MGEGLLQPMHLLVILVIAVLVFGPKKLPELVRILGRESAASGMRSRMRRRGLVRTTRTLQATLQTPPRRSNRRLPVFSVGCRGSMGIAACRIGSGVALCRVRIRAPRNRFRPKRIVS